MYIYIYIYAVYICVYAYYVYIYRLDIYLRIFIFCLYIYIRNVCIYIYILFDWVVTLPSNSYNRIIMYILVEDPCPHLPLLLGRGTTPYYIAYKDICSVCTIIGNCIMLYQSLLYPGP